MINIVLSLLFFLMSSCGDGFEEDDLLYLHVVNNSETPICVFIQWKAMLNLIIHTHLH